MWQRTDHIGRRVIPTPEIMSFHMRARPLTTGKEPPEGRPEFSFEDKQGLPKTEPRQDHQGQLPPGMDEGRKRTQYLIELPRAVQPGEVRKDEVKGAFVPQPFQSGKRA